MESGTILLASNWVCQYLLLQTTRWYGVWLRIAEWSTKRLSSSMLQGELIFSSETITPDSNFTSITFAGLTVRHPDLSHYNRVLTNEKQGDGASTQSTQAASQLPTSTHHEQSWQATQQETCSLPSFPTCPLSRRVSTLRQAVGASEIGHFSL